MDDLLPLPKPARQFELAQWYFPEQMWQYARANLAARQSEAEAILLELLRTGEALPVDSIICYASTMTEYEPNRLAKEFNDALAAARAWRDSHGR